MKEKILYEKLKASENDVYLLQQRINKVTRHIEVLLEIALEQDSENVNLIDRLKEILNTLKGKDTKY